MPKKLDAANPALYAFTGWYPKPEKITGNLTCYAQFTILDSVWYTVGIGDFGEYLSNNVIQVGHALNADGTVYLTKYNNYLNSAVLVPKDLAANGQYYMVTRLGGFNAHTELELIKLPESLEVLLSNAFMDCKNLYEITLPESLKTIRARALNGCDGLKEIIIPTNVEIIEDIAFAECRNLSKLEVAGGNSKFAIVQDCLIDLAGKRLVQGLGSSTIPQDGSVTTLGQYCFSRMLIKAAKIPDSIKTVSVNAFSRCTLLQDVELPSTLTELGDACFSWCSALAKIDLPEGLTTIKTYAFNECALETVVIPSTVTNIMQRAFGYMSTLKTVTFKKTVDTDGNIVLPTIHFGAFEGSGKQDSPVVFNLPWSEEQHYAKYTDSPHFSASYYTFNFDYEEAN